jgi:N-methylhydantoinase B
LRIEQAGGSGYGNPRDREPALVLADVRNGYVSVESAFNEYGVRVVAHANGTFELGG